MDIQNKDQFQPSSDTLKFWLATRKPSFHVAGVDLPGFFSDTDSTKDYNWFTFAIIGELFGFILTIYGGMKSGGIFLIIAIFAVLAFITIDLAFAKLLHADEAEKCELRSKKLCINDDISVVPAAMIDVELKKGAFRKYFLKGSILLIACCKCFGVVVLSVFAAFSIYIPLFVIFFIIAYAHIYHTGYHFAYRKAVSQRDKDYEVFKRGKGYLALELQQSFLTNTELVFNPGANSIEHYPHKVIFVSNSSDKYKYEIHTRGVLTDADILALIARQDKINKIELFKACRELQFIILNSQQRIDINS